MAIARRPILIASHERSGTHLLLDVLRRNFAACRVRPRLGSNPHDWLYFSLDRLCEGHPRGVGVAFAESVLARAQRPLLKSHGLPGFGGIGAESRAWLDRTLGLATTLHVVRDGRAVMPAFHRHQRAIDAKTPESFSSFLRTPIDGVTPPERWANHTRQWLAEPGAHVVRFESILNDTGRVLEGLAAALGEPLGGVRRPLPARARSSWPARMARVTGCLESSNLAERGPRTPRWTELFSQDDREFFDRHAGGMLDAIGSAEALESADRPIGVGACHGA